MIFIEGLPGAGKTTLIRLLEKQGRDIEHELGHVIPASEFPGNGETIEAILGIDDWFINKEKARLERKKTSMIEVI